MDKREFLKTSGVFLAGTILSPFGSGEQSTAPRTNWSGNYTYGARQLYEPIEGFSNVSVALRQVDEDDRARQGMADALNKKPKPKPKSRSSQRSRYATRRAHWH